MKVRAALRNVAVKAVWIASAAGVLVGCGYKPCELIGACDPPPLPPIVLHLLVDASDGTTVSVTDVSTTIETTLAAVFARPGSSLHPWIMGAEPTATKKVAAPVVSDMSISSAPERVKRQRIEDAVRRAKAQLMDAYAPFLSGKRPKKSPIAESLTKIGLENEYADGQHILIVATDGRQVGPLADFECSVPDIRTFTKTLRNNDVLQPKVLTGISVLMTRFELIEVAGSRCPATVSSNRKIEALWRESLAQAGASQVVFLAGNVTASALENITSTKQEASR